MREAVAGAPGVLRLYRPRNASQNGSYSTFSDEGRTLSRDFDQVAAVSLDGLFERHQIECCNLMKIDVEGQEYDILYAASDATLERIERIHGEYHNVRPEDPRTRIAGLASHLRSKGYVFEAVPHRKKTNHGMFYAVRQGLG